MLLNEDQQMIRDAVRSFVQAQITPHAARWDKEHHFPKDVHQGLAALGCYGICVPEQYGGAGLDYLSLAVVLEEIAAGDGGTSTVISVTNCPVNAILMRYGSEAQKQQWLTPLARGEMLGAFCLTEPHVGSDASALRTTAVREGNDYVIHGVKQFITSGKNGDVAIVIAVTDKAAGKKGMSAFLVPTSSPGYIVARPKTSWASTAAIRHRSTLITAAFPRKTSSARKVRATRLPCLRWKGGALALPHKAWAWPVRPLNARCNTARSARALASPSSTTRPWAFAWPIAPRRSRRHAS